MEWEISMNTTQYRVRQAENLVHNQLTIITKSLREVMGFLTACCSAVRNGVIPWTALVENTLHDGLYAATILSVPDRLVYKFTPCTDERCVATCFWATDGHSQLLKKLTAVTDLKLCDLVPTLIRCNPVYIPRVCSLKNLHLSVFERGSLHSVSRTKSVNDRGSISNKDRDFCLQSHLLIAQSV
jgi:hypothetical protein